MSNLKDFETFVNVRCSHCSRFYAPWCGHCQRLSPQYQKAAENLKGIAKVAAVNCDDDENKSFCGRMGVQGFPTLKIVRPSKDPKRVGKPNIEDYQGARTGKAIVEAVVAAMQNHVQRVTDADIEKFFNEKNETVKALIFSEKGTTASMTKALAVDFLGGITFGQIRNNQKEAVEMFGIQSFPALVVLPGGAADAELYKGQMHKDEMSKFLSKFAEPNPDAAGKAAKEAPKSKSTQTSESSSSSTSTPPPVPTFPVLESPEALQSTCLTPKSATCILLLLDSWASSQSDSAAAPPSLKAMAAMYAKRGKSMPNAYAVPASNNGGFNLLGVLELKDGYEKLLAVNGKKGWYQQFNPGVEAFDATLAESWIDGIKMGDGKKEKLPEGIVAEEVVKGESEDKVTEESTEPESEQEPIQIEVEEAPDHDEL